MNWRRESPAAAQHEQVGKWPLRESNVMASVPVLTFVSCSGTLLLRMSEPKGHWQKYDSGALSISRPAKIG
jgi:hypothetical protein